MIIVVIISADAEWRTVKELYPGLQQHPSPFGEYAELVLDDWHLILFQGGWGKISAAASAQFVIDHFQPALLVNLGTCGGFAGRIETGTTLLVEKTLVYDIIEQMTDSTEAIAYYVTELDLSWLAGCVPALALRGLLLSADRDIVVADIPTLVEKYGAVAADWESGAIAWVAQKNGCRCLILRAVSDLVGTGGGEAYGSYDLFVQRTRTVMKTLFKHLPAWLAAVNWE